MYIGLLMVNFVVCISKPLCKLIGSKFMMSLASFKVPRGENQKLELFCLLIGATMGQEAGRLRAAQQISNATSGGGHRLLQVTG